ncbi:MAG TPA: hypothetical protein VMW89_03255 [Desulfatiglandales bacterium]|nr:hypothetical protein [Desulfatiglandales bacterium]
MLITYDTLRELVGAESYDLVKHYHREWVEEYLQNGNYRRDDKWTKSIAVGSKGFVENVKSTLGVLAKGRNSKETGESYQLREPLVPYGEHIGVKNEGIGLENVYYWKRL